MSCILSKSTIIMNNKISVDRRVNSKNSPTHTHDFLEMLYVYKGTAIHHYKGQSIPIKPGSFFFVDYDTEHNLTHKSTGFSAITCTFTPEFIDNSLLGCTGIIDVLKSYSINLYPFSVNSINLFEDESGRILKILNLMLNEYEKKDAGYLSFMRSYLIQIMILTMRKIELVSNNLDDRIKAILDYTNEHYDEQIALTALCGNFHCSISNISILFKSQLGMTFTEYLRKLRLNASCHLLTGTYKSIWEVANNVGYNDVRTFRKHFKEQFGMTPLQFRKTSL